MTAFQVGSIVFLAVMVILIFRGVRGHPRRQGAAELDATGRAVGEGSMRMASRLETETFSASDGGGAGD